LGWLPEKQDWTAALDQARKGVPEQALSAFIQLANSRMDFIQTQRLDRAVQQVPAQMREKALSSRPVRLALLGSCTLTHLIPGIRMGALRRGIWVDIYEGSYGMYRQELQDLTSALHQFRPDVLLLSLDAYHLVSAREASVEDALQTLGVGGAEDRPGGIRAVGRDDRVVHRHGERGHDKWASLFHERIENAER